MKSLSVLLIAPPGSLRVALQDVLEMHDIYVDIAASLESAIVMVEKQPDVVLLASTIPGVRSEQVLQAVQEQQAVPVIVVADASVEEAAKTVSLMSRGAMDFIRSGPEAHGSLHFDETTVLAKVKEAGGMKQKKERRKPHTIQKIKKEEQASTRALPKHAEKVAVDKHPLIVLGTSTGGPRALQELFTSLPNDFPIPILIVQHMPPGFTKSLAERLHLIGTMKVKEAIDGENIQKNTAYIAPGNYHMEVVRPASSDTFAVQLTQDRADLPHRPSVDVLFESIAHLDDVYKIAVILTGMGKDGQAGIQAIKAFDEAAVILAESKETAVIDGMPKAATDTKLVTEVIRLDAVGETLDKYRRKWGK